MGGERWTTSGRARLRARASKQNIRTTRSRDKGEFQLTVHATSHPTRVATRMNDAKRFRVDAKELVAAGLQSNQRYNPKGGITGSNPRLRSRENDTEISQQPEPVIQSGTRILRNRSIRRHNWDLQQSTDHHQQHQQQQQQQELFLEEQRYFDPTRETFSDPFGETMMTQGEPMEFPPPVPAAFPYQQQLYPQQQEQEYQHPSLFAANTGLEYTSHYENGEFQSRYENTFDANWGPPQTDWRQLRPEQSFESQWGASSLSHLQLEDRSSPMYFGVQDLGPFGQSRGPFSSGEKSNNSTLRHETLIVDDSTFHPPQEVTVRAPFASSLSSPKPDIGQHPLPSPGVSSTITDPWIMNENQKHAWIPPFRTGKDPHHGSTTFDPSRVCPPFQAEPPFSREDRNADVAALHALESTPFPMVQPPPLFYTKKRFAESSRGVAGICHETWESASLHPRFDSEVYSEPPPFERHQVERPSFDPQAQNHHRASTGAFSESRLMARHPSHTFAESTVSEHLSPEEMFYQQQSSYRTLDNLPAAPLVEAPNRLSGSEQFMHVLRNETSQWPAPTISEIPPTGIPGDSSENGLNDPSHRPDPAVGLTRQPFLDVTDLYQSQQHHPGDTHMSSPRKYSVLDESERMPVPPMDRYPDFDTNVPAVRFFYRNRQVDMRGIPVATTASATVKHKRRSDSALSSHHDPCTLEYRTWKRQAVDPRNPSPMIKKKEHNDTDTSGPREDSIGKKLDDHKPQPEEHPYSREESKFELRVASEGARIKRPDHGKDCQSNLSRNDLVQSSLLPPEQASHADGSAQDNSEEGWNAASNDYRDYADTKRDCVLDNADARNTANYPEDVCRETKDYERAPDLPQGEQNPSTSRRQPYVEEEEEEDDSSSSDDESFCRQLRQQKTFWG